MTSLSELKFFATPSHDCSYIDGQQAVTLFVDPTAELDCQLYTALAAVGFRRSGSHIYRPYCQTCSACIPVRLPVAEFQPRRAQLRTWKRNLDLQVTEEMPSYSEDYYDLYARYIRSRHADGDMYPPEVAQFKSFLVECREETRFYEFRSADKLLSIAVADRLQDGLSAIYTFFDPDEPQRSLGVQAVLWLIEEAKRLNLSYLFLGYWIKQCQKMNYKLEYRPIELFINSHWIPLN